MEKVTKEKITLENHLQESVAKLEVTGSTAKQIDNGWGITQTGEVRYHWTFENLVECVYCFSRA